MIYCMCTVQVSSGVNIVGDATKAVGTGVVQGTKVSRTEHPDI